MINLNIEFINDVLLISIDVSVEAYFYALNSRAHPTNIQNGEK